MRHLKSVVLIAWCALVRASHPRSIEGCKVRPFVESCQHGAYPV